MPIDLTCAHCGRAFSRPPSLAKQQYCSGACWQAASWVNRTCAVCGQSFRARASEIRKGGGVVCSAACRYPRRPMVERFWEKIICDIVTRCWRWTGTTLLGYGRFGRGGRDGGTAQAHRVSWEINVGPIPPGMSVLHSCDVNWPPGDIGYRRCVNPSHLFLGTDRDNNRWMAAVGRSTRGERNPGARLAEADVVAIRERHADGASIRSLMESFGVSETTISEVVNRRRWRHIGGHPGVDGTC